MIRIVLTVIFIVIGAVSPFSAIPRSFAAENIKRAPALRAPPKEQDIQYIQYIRVEDNRISLDVRDANIADVLTELAQKAGIEITLGEGITGTVSIKLTEATIEEALNNLCQSRALVYEYLPDKKTYHIIHAVALTGARGRQGGSQGGHPRDEGSEAKQALPEALDREVNRQPGIWAVEGEQGPDTDNLGRPLYRSGELLVKFTEGVTDQQKGDLHLSLGSRVMGSMDKLSLQRIRLREGLSEQAATALYRGADIVEYVERHALRYPNLVPNDPEFSKQWGLVTIKAQETWDITQGSQEVVVAVIDTGVKYTHEDLQENIWINTAESAQPNGVDDDGNGYIDDIRGWDFADGDNSPMDIKRHGTHVAGIIAAGGNNGRGIAGVNWHIKIMPLKVQADTGSEFAVFDIVQAIHYAIAKKARIVNCSFGGSSSSVSEENAFRDLKNAGILAVCAAGNDGLDSDVPGQDKYPSGYPLENIISVAASDKNDNLASFSNYGLTSVDVLAPGVDIYSTVPEGTTTGLVKVGGVNPVEYRAIGMLFAGITDANGLTKTAYDCGKGYREPDLNEFPPEVAGNIALIERGRSSNPGALPFTFAQKVQNAKTAGAVGVIIYNNVVDDFDMNGGTLSDSSVKWMPVVSISMADGAALKAALQALGTPLVTLINKQVTSPYDFMKGTSMAAPHVTGIAGLITAQCPALGYGEIKSAILDHVDKIPAAAGKVATAGRVNALAALTSLLSPADLTGDCRVGLGDAVLAMQILSGLPPQVPYPCPSCGKDVNGDGKIGLQELVFIMQKTAGLR